MDDLAAKLKCLQANPVFARAPRNVLAGVAAGAEFRHWRDAERILSEGDPASHVYALCDGVVRVFLVSPAGAQIVLKVFRAPAVFGEAEAFSGVPHLENVEALGPAAAVALPTDVLLQLLRDDPETGLALSVDLAARLAIAIQNCRSVAFNAVSTRLANFLLEYVAWAFPAGARDAAISLTQDDMAASLGIARRSVAEDIAAWQREGILERRGKWYVVRDLEGLRRYGDPDHLGVNYRLSERIATVSARLEGRLAARRRRKAG